ncbi:hypothetical protein V6R21_32250 [Limibacter armeniacum]|uniref:hypothetical protein n=1 Tax=Limibacter armeniacum TaxID=466084 RepID=UPI002FE62EF8
MRHGDYITMMKQMQEAHIDLKGYARIITGADPIQSAMDIESFLVAKGKKRQSQQLPLLMVETTETGYLDNGADNHLRDSAAGFFILDKATTDDEKDEAISIAEVIAEDCIGYIKKHLLDNRAKYFMSIQDLRIEKIGNLASQYYGVYVSFLFRTNSTTDLKYKPEKFTANG